MMNEVMRLTTFFVTLAVTSLFATTVALAAAGLSNTSGKPLLCANCAVATAAKPPNVSAFHSRRALGPSFRPS